MEYAIIFLPLVGSIIGYLGRSIIKYFSEVVTSLFVCLSAIFSIIVFWNGIKITHMETIKFLNGLAQEVLLQIGQLI